MATEPAVFLEFPKEMLIAGLELAGKWASVASVSGEPGSPKWGEFWRRKMAAPARSEAGALDCEKEVPG